ncbi:saccharopine dehydrogenase NADP-binding domain-containing protein [Neobacillus sp. YIM B02564]|uniref:Saccharopine dehydrogenase NADP-binding domain-containing protein n=1 Tax=Neobacillus paridis TaxID=2803862 RepID=A0ABS1THI8_9BACI|nr:saccharopine dehydrogenase C-terminal domain-containing protein [Neobacillus paridis]MBL4950781.1 saccharopine dehydrogenase NADP-binding domain-containing protein [Neobacillus paridis]
MSFNVVILGVGGVGQVCASEVVKKEYLTKLVLADISTKAAEKLAQALRKTSSATIEVCQVDASNTKSVASILDDVNVLLHAGIPEFNYSVMQACVETKTHYIDMASDGPDDLLKQLDWGDQFKQAGVLGIMGLGCDPGFSNIAARYAADQLDTVKSITILDGDNSEVDYEGFCAYFSPQTAIQECLAKPNYWTAKGGLQYYPTPFANKDEFEFPDPIGWLDCYVVEHEEAVTLGKSIGKGCEYVEFRYALHPDFVNTLKVLSYLGLDSKEPINVGGVEVVPRDVVVTTMPKPAELAGKIHGYSCVGAYVKGTKGGQNVELYVYTIANHDEIYEKVGFQATVWQTGVPPVVAVDMIAEGLLTETGCIPPEKIDPVPFLERMQARGMEWYVMKKTSPIIKTA